jgi:hypothetical protein
VSPIFRRAIDYGKVEESSSSPSPSKKYGEIRCYIRGPDGYIIEVGQSTDLTYGQRCHAANTAYMSRLPHR